jgi:hypothetical protein
VLRQLALLSTIVGIAGVCVASAAATPALPPELVALEQKMGQLQINSERYEQTQISVSRTTTLAKHGKSRTNIRHRSSKVSGAVSLSPAEGELAGPGGVPSEIDVGSTLYLHFADIARRDGGRPWVRVEHASASVLFPFHGGSLPFGEVDEGGTGSYAQLINLIATADGAVEVVGPATVGGQRTTEFTAVVEPLRLIKGLSSKELAEQRAHPLREKLDVCITESGLPVRVIQSVELRRPRHYLAASLTTELTAVEAPVAFKPPPEKETISEAQFEKLERIRASSGSSVTITFKG